MPPGLGNRDAALGQPSELRKKGTENGSPGERPAGPCGAGCSAPEFRARCPSGTEQGLCTCPRTRAPGAQALRTSDHMLEASSGSQCRCGQGAAHRSWRRAALATALVNLPPEPLLSFRLKTVTESQLRGQCLREARPTQGCRGGGACPEACPEVFTPSQQHTRAGCESSRVAAEGGRITTCDFGKREAARPRQETRGGEFRVSFNCKDLGDLEGKTFAFVSGFHTFPLQILAALLPTLKPPLWPA